MRKEQKRERTHEILLPLNDVLQLCQPVRHVLRTANRDRLRRRVEDQVELLAFAEDDFFPVPP